MLTFWIAASLLMALVLILLMRAFVRANQDAGLSPADVYDAQLQEVEREAQVGLIPEQELENARTEISRRRARAVEGVAPGPAARPSLVVAAVIAGSIIIGTLTTYLVIGRPDLPAQPFALRDIDAETAARLAPTTAQIEADLAAIDHPADRALYLADLFMQLEAYEDARASFANALEHRPGDVAARIGLGEVSVIQNSGVVGETAREQFDAALDIDPAAPRAVFYRSLYDFQRGDSEAALSRLDALLADAPPSVPWRGPLEGLRDRIAEAAAERGGAEAVLALEGADRENAIRGMVDRLAARLEENPDDFDGWMTLANARAVLEEREAAAAALAEAARLAAGDPALSARVESLAEAHNLPLPVESITSP